MRVCNSTIRCLVPKSSPLCAISTNVKLKDRGGRLTRFTSLSNI